MDKHSKEDFIAWTVTHNWMPLGESKTPEGYPQEAFLTPAGNIVFAIFDHEGYLKNVALPMPPMPMSMPMPRQNPPFNIPGSGLPFIKG